MKTPVEVLALKGTLDNQKGKLLLETGEIIVQDPQTVAILLDLTKVKFIDSAGLGALVKMLKLAESHGKRFSICNLGAQVSMLIKLTRMDNMFEIFEDLSRFCKALNRDLSPDRWVTPEKLVITNLEDE